MRSIRGRRLISVSPENGTRTEVHMMVSFECSATNACVATDPYPISIGPAGSLVPMCAVNTDVEVKFTGKSPFKSKKKHFWIAAGTCTPLEEVAPAANGTKFGFSLVCSNDGDPTCPTPAS